jgi:hypothetical protein
MPRDAPQVRILSSPEALAKARAAAEAYAETSAGAQPSPRPINVEIIGRSRLTDAIKDYARGGEAQLEQLRGIAAGTGAPAFAASVCLVRLGHGHNGPRLSEFLATETSPALGECFTWIGMNGELVRPLPDLEALRQHAERIAQQPDHPDREPALRAAFELGTELATVEIVDALVRAGGSGPSVDVYWIIDALTDVVRHGGDPGLAAGRALLQPPFLDRSGATRAGRLRDPRLVPDLERVLSSAPKKSSAVLTALARVQGAEVLPRLLEALQDPELASSMPAAIGIAAEGTGDESIIAALAMATAPTRGAAVAIARIGGPLALRTAAGLCRRGSRTLDAMEIAWRVKGITASSAVHRFVDAGVIPVMPTDEELRAAADSRRGRDLSDVQVFFDHFLRDSGRLAEATGEDIHARDAAQHPSLIERFAKATGGVLPIEHLSQIDGPQDQRGEREIEIQFVCGERVYQLTTKVNGRWFDFTAVRILLNEALRDRGRNERFTRVQGFDDERLIFGPQAAVEAACDELFIPRGTERAERYAWSDRLQEMLLQAAGAEPRTPAAIDLAFHIIRPTGAGAFPHDAVNDAVARVLGPATSVAVTTGAGWTELEVPINLARFKALGAEAIASLFVSLCDLTGAHLGRTMSGSGWARITEGELAGAIDALDWLQYFGPRFGTWLRSSRVGLQAHQSPGGAQVVTAPLDPLAPSWHERRILAKRSGLMLRPFPESSQAELDPAARLARVLPPAPAEWRPEERPAMLRARAATLQAIEKGMANGQLFDRFRRRYLAEELGTPRLDRLATWLPHYGAAAATAAFRAVARLHDAHPAAAPMDDIALEGCVKLVAWAGDDRPLLERELYVEHIVDPKDPAVAAFGRQADNPNIIGGLIKMTAQQLKGCQCERCTETRRILGRRE